MDGDIINRIQDIIDWTKMSQRQFGTLIGFPHYTINNYLLRKRTTIDAKLLENIIETFDDINADWLLTGRGEMLKDFNSVSDLKEDRVPYGVNTDPMQSLIKQQSELISQQKNIIDTLNEEIKRLRSQAFINSSNEQEDAAGCADVSGF